MRTPWVNNRIAAELSNCRNIHISIACVRARVDKPYRMRREQNEWVGKDCAPDDGCKNPGASLCNCSGACDVCVSVVVLHKPVVERAIPMTRLWYSGRPSCCDASPGLPSKGSCSPMPGLCVSCSDISVQSLVASCNSESPLRKKIITRCVSGRRAGKSWSQEKSPGLHINTDSCVPTGSSYDDLADLDKYPIHPTYPIRS